jgi:nucleotide-binding universal stress UspA family protein
LTSFKVGMLWSAPRLVRTGLGTLATAALGFREYWPQDGIRTMRSLLLLIDRDAGQDARLAAAIDIARNLESRLVCLQTTPWQSYGFSGDPFGASYLPPEVFQSVRDAENEDRNVIEGQLEREGVDWVWRHVEGGAAERLAEHATLADLVILSRPEPRETFLPRATPLAADVAVHIQSPVLVVPAEDKKFASKGPALIAWNGSAEAGHAVRLSLPLLRAAGEVHIVSVSEDKEAMPPGELSDFLARHGIQSRVHHRPGGEASIADALVSSAEDIGAANIVLGAYGHSRIRETILGGVTREMILNSPVPMVLAH